MSQTTKQVPKWKFAIIVWIAIYPAITIILALFSDYLMLIPVYVRTLALTLVLVPLMVFVLIPTLSKLFAGWLRR